MTRANATLGLPVVVCDFHSVQAHGVPSSDCHSTLVVGQNVMLRDEAPGEDIRVYARVSRKDMWRQRIYFDIDWDTTVVEHRDPDADRPVG